MDAPSLNIVELIENNPITKLSSAYNSKLLVKIQESFTDFEQQLFLSSFYCYLNCDQKNDFVIDLDDIWKWLGFSQKAPAKYLLEKQFVIDNDYKLFALSSGGAKKGRGGHNKDTILLSVKTFKSMCLKAGTKKADEIHEYYLKMEEIIHCVMQEESGELKMQLESAKQEINQIVETNKNEIHGKVAREREKMLLHEFGMSGALIYLIKVKTNEDKSYIIKIGESRKGVRDRYNEHKTKYGDDILLLDCYAVKRSKEMESFILHHDKIRPSQVSNLPGHEKELELFLIGKSLSYNTVTQLIKNNMKQFNEFSTEKLEHEIQMLRDIITNSNNSSMLKENDIIQELLNNQKIMMKMIQNLEATNKEILQKMDAAQPQIKTATVFQEPLVTLGPRLQQINPDTLTLNKVYESVAECLKESNFVLKRPSIVKAVTENTVYHGYRWFFVDRDEDATKINNLQPTKVTKQQNLGYIAKLNTAKTEILNVYIDRKTAATNNNFPFSSFDTIVKNESLANGHYYFLYDNCDADVISKYEDEKGEPLLYKDGVGQFDAQGKMVKEYVCKYDCIKQMKMSDKSLAKVLDTPNLYNGFCFRRIGSKTFV